VGNVVDVLSGNYLLAKRNGLSRKSGLRWTAEVHYNFDEVIQFRMAMKRLTNVRRHDAEK
jgi:hypothetical protein